MYKSYYYPQVKTNEEKVVLYVTSIGKDADTKIRKVFTRLGLINPRIRVSKLGNLKAIKYSFLLSDENALFIMTKSMKHMLFTEFDNIMLYSKSKKDYMIMNDIEYFQ